MEPCHDTSAVTARSPRGRLRSVLGTVVACTLAAWLSGCGGGGGSTAGPVTPVATTASVGEAIFHDTSLSASGRQACATCHVPASGHADPAGTVLPLGGPAMDLQGLRSSMSLGYLSENTAFRLNIGQPEGGFMWDGRADSRQAQAALPLLDPREMANASVADAAARLRRAAYFADLLSVSGLGANASDQRIFDAATLAVATYQAEDSDYQRFNSRFDQVLDGKASFTAQEARGLAIFNDPNRGACARCHTSATSPDGRRPLFTNFRYAALGLPRNPAIQANADPAFFDMGLCGPKRTDLSARTDLCGQFRIPSLRNVALTAPYFHNASVATLEEAVSFYATRDINPGRWYPLVGGVPDKFNDLPAGLRGNVIRTAPFGQSPGDPPRLTAQDTADLAAFLRTLSDDLSAPANSAFVGR